MIRVRPKNKQKLEKALKNLLNKPPLRFSLMTSSAIPEVAGVYLITRKKGSAETPYYIGRSKNIKDRLYGEHLKRTGFKKYLIDQNICSTLKEAKNFTMKYCAVRWLKEDNYRVRGMMEGYFTALLSPKCGIYEEH